MNSYPVIAWRDLISYEPDLVVTHSADAEGYPFLNLSDWRDYTFWKSAESGTLIIKLDASALPGQAVAVDCLAIAGHNLGSAGVTDLVLSWSNDDIIYTPCFDPVTPESDKVLFRFFPEQTRRFFKLIIPSGYTESPRIGVLFIGAAMAIPAFPDAGFDPDTKVADMAADYSRTGRLLGIEARFLRRELKLNFSRLSASFITDTWIPFWNLHGMKPFFFAWDPGGRPEETYLVRLSSPRLEAPYTRAFRSLSLTMTGAAGD